MYLLCGTSCDWISLNALDYLYRPLYYSTFWMWPDNRAQFIFVLDIEISVQRVPYNWSKKKMYSHVLSCIRVHWMWLIIVQPCPCHVSVCIECGPVIHVVQLAQKRSQLPSRWSPSEEIVRASIDTQPIVNGPVRPVDCGHGTIMDLITFALTTHPWFK